MQQANKPFVTLAILGIVLSLLSLAKLVHGNEPLDLAALPAELDEQDTRDNVERVDRAIRYLLRRSPCWGIASDADARRGMAAKIDHAARTHGVPPMLLTVMAKRESSFQPDVVGSSRGERGVLQVHGLAARRCDLSTVEGQLDCGARWLRKSFDLCGDWRGAVTAYMSGRCEAGRKSRLGKAADSRVTQWENARDAVDRCRAGTADNETQWLCEPPQNKCVARIRAIRGDA